MLVDVTSAAAAVVAARSDRRVRPEAETDAEEDVVDDAEWNDFEMLSNLALLSSWWLL